MMTPGRRMTNDQQLHIRSDESDEITTIRVELNELREQINKLRLWQAFVLGASSAVGALISVGLMLAGKLLK